MKKQILLPITLLFIMAFSLVSGATTLVVPTAGYNYTSFTFNVTYTNVTDITDPLSANSSLYCNYSGTMTKMTITSFACLGATTAECTGNVALTTAMDTRGVHCNMSLGNDSTSDLDATGEDDITFDSTPPTIIITQPENETAFTIDWINISLNITHADALLKLSARWWSKDTGLTNTTFAGNQVYMHWEGLLRGSTYNYNLMACVNDSVNNIDCNYSYITLITSPRMGLSGGGGVRVGVDEVYEAEEITAPKKENILVTEIQNFVAWIKNMLNKIFSL